MFLVDDLGWYDSPWHNPDLDLPHFAALKTEGVELDRAYAYRFCSPSRSSFLSGRLPFHVNQFNKAGDSIGGGVHVNMTTIADKLRLAGYATHQLGKWHAGQSSPDLVPAARGFDTSLGYLNGQEDHWNQYREACGDATFVDLYATDGPAFGKNGTYGDATFRDAALDVVAAHDASRPLFLYYAPQINHSPLQVPAPYLDRYPCGDANCTTRQTYQAMTAFLDDVLGNVTAAMQTAGLWDDTVFVMSADNGGPSGSDADDANNYPLRGGKYSDFEGGVRVSSVVAGGRVPASMRGAVLVGVDSYVHLVDWYATFCALAGLDAADDDAVDQTGARLPGTDGFDVWPLVSGANATSPRTELPLTLGPHQPGGSNGALIVGNYKLLLGTQLPAIVPGRTYPNGTAPGPLSLDCGDDGCLFDVIEDPTETTDLAASRPDVLSTIRARFDELSKTAYQTPYLDGQMNCTDDPRVVEMMDRGFWTPWTDRHAPPF